MKKRLPLLLVCLLPLPVVAADWPQFLGPRRDDISKETGLLKPWPEGGPKLLWTYSDAGIGYSGPAVVHGKLYSMGARGDSEYVFALDLKDGRELWHGRIGPVFSWKGNYWNAGPSATPTVNDGSVYALGGLG